MGGEGEPLIRHILVGVDGSPHGFGAARWAGRLAASLGARLTLVHVVPLPGSAYELGFAEGPIPRGVPGAEALRRQADTVLEQAALAAQLPSERLGTRSEIGVPARALVRLADQLGVDLIVVGHRGLRPLSEVLLGSTSQQVLHAAHCPVTVV